MGVPLKIKYILITSVCHRITHFPHTVHCFRGCKCPRVFGMVAIFGLVYRNGYNIVHVPSEKDFIFIHLR